MSNDESVRESHRPAVVDVSHSVHMRQAQATFANDVVLAVTYSDQSVERGFTCELTHPTVGVERWGDATVERPPAEVLIEILSDFYNAAERNNVATLDGFMREVESDE
jgi:hypothetical protein